MTDKLIKKLCDKYGIKKYTINFDGSIDVNKPVNLSNFDLTELPLKFNKVNGSFDCSDNRLTTLKGCPNEVSDSFFFENNPLERIDYTPNRIGDGKGIYSDSKHNIGEPMTDDVNVFYNIENNYKLLTRSVRIKYVLNDK